MGFTIASAVRPSTFPAVSNFGYGFNESAHVFPGFDPGLGSASSSDGAVQSTGSRIREVILTGIEAVGELYKAKVRAKTPQEPASPAANAAVPQGTVAQAGAGAGNGIIGWVLIGLGVLLFIRVFSK